MHEDIYSISFTFARLFGSDAEEERRMRGDERVSWPWWWCGVCGDVILGLGGLGDKDDDENFSDVNNDEGKFGEWW